MKKSKTEATKKKQDDMTAFHEPIIKSGKFVPPVKGSAKSNLEEEKESVAVKEPERYRIKQCPNPTLYLSAFKEIPKQINDAKYLSKNYFEKVILTSYPRSGNTLLRKYLEDITGVITGSD